MSENNNTTNSSNSDSTSASTSASTSTSAAASTSASASAAGPKNTSKKMKKKPGIIRWNAIIPLCLFILLSYLYFHFFFDKHMRSLIEWGGYKALGSEVNVKNFTSSFLKGRVDIEKIELTSTEQPDYNSLEISSIKFDLNWDALLRMKFVIEEMSAEGLQFMSKRDHRGKVAPPEPSKPDEPSFTDQLKGKALDKLSENKNNVLGDIAGFLKSGDINAQLKNIESTIASKKMAEDLKTKWTDKKTQWDQTIKTLPTEKDLQSFKTRFDGIKYKDFKSVQELEASINQFNSLKSDIDSKFKVVDAAKNNLTSDLQSIQSDYQGLDKQIKADIDSLKTRFKIPKLNAGQFAKSLFMDYLTPYTQKLDHYKKMAQKYLPPKYAKMLDPQKEKSKQASGQVNDDSIQPLPREVGQSYEFPITTGYPLFWVQNVKVSSKSNARVDYGDVTGVIKNITSNQRQIGKETTLDVSGDFKSQKVFGFKTFAAFNNMRAEPEVRFNIDVNKYFIKGIDLMNSADGKIHIPESNNTLSIDGKSVGFKTYDLSLKNDFKNVAFAVEAKEKIVDDILKQTFASIKDFDLKASAKGEIKNLDIDISSSLGEKLEKSFGSLLQKKLDEVNAQIKEKIDAEIGKVKKQVDDQVNAFKNQIQGEVNKAQAQLDQKKKEIDDRIASAKKDMENQAKSKLQQEGQKALDELKKKMGF